MTTTTLHVRGMRCAGCVTHVEQDLQAVPGVRQALVNLATEQATVTHDPQQAPVGRLVQAVRDAGYEAEAPSGEAAEDHSHAAGASPSLGPSHPAPLAAAHAQYDHAHTIADSASLRPVLLCLPAASAVAVLGMFFHGPAWSAWAQLVLATPVQVVLGLPFYRGAAKAAAHGRADMDTLVALGTTVAFAYSAAVTVLSLAHPADHAVHVYFDTAVVILVLIGVGKFMEMRARRHAAAAIRGLVELQPATAAVVRGGAQIDIPVSQLRVGDEVLVRPGQRVPVDGQVLEGRSAVDQSLVTGESMPVEVAPGSAVIGGTLNHNGAFRFRATRTGAATFLAQVIDLVNRAQASKARVQRLADAVAGVFVPVVLVVAVATLLGWGLAQGDWVAAMRYSVAVLIVACPCALGLATPTAIMVGTGLGARRGILIKDTAALERAGTVTHVILDKTGTLTVGRPEVVAVEAIGSRSQEAEVGSQESRVRRQESGGHAEPFRAGSTATAPGADDVLALAASVEALSEHPLGKAIVEHARQRGLALLAVEDFQSVAGGGVRGIVQGRRVAVGRPQVKDQDVARWRSQGATVVQVTVDDAPAGMIALADAIKPGAAEAVAALHKMGLKVILMTGDHRAAAEAVATRLGIDQILAEVLPADKHAKVVELQRRGCRVAMVGDGINDAPALAAADLGIAMGEGVRNQGSGVRGQEPEVGAAEAQSGGGTDIARAAGHIILTGGDVRGVAGAISLSRAMMRRIRLGLFWAFAYNAVLIPVAAAGWLHPMLAAAAMAFSSVSVVGNALWLRRAWRG